ncbi:TPA: hypothetical protein ACJ14G_001800 [Klebsiella pneumoniae]|uniref:hypothetical protein n=1 Tax=Gammaproteobacteria TaxID=1236 RepID=UPI00049EE407|nr:hypothetical protein [Klebsiella pneumoniae]ELC3074527.1 hypothetical protein [Pluralibacter gergoviae]EMF0761812.1 hypothetical protein [Klebsiella variicola]HDG7822587.1 hypothetical protein [Klebsiella quasipneumoniae]EIV9539667.1 hypothetical protein [Klebsiella pneumoniae]KDL83206.1 hypothetical protein AD98_02939 [Klebsiella pneumoniae MGH 72]
MSKNWMRHFELVLTDNEGKGLVLSEFKATFEIEWNDNKWPSVATVRVYNVSSETANRIMGREFSKMKIIAGYDGIAPVVPASEVGKVHEVDPSQVGQMNGANYGVIFSGDIRFTVTGKDNVTDSWVQVQACDGQEAFTKAFISTTLAKGYTVKDVYNVLMRALEPFGIVGGAVPEFPSTVFPRGRVLHGTVQQYLDNVAQQCGARWQFAYGRVDMLSADMAMHKAVVLNSDTGLVGMPQQTIGGGVNVKCLINPNIRLNGLIQLDQTSIYRAQLSGEQVKQSGLITVDTVNGNQVTTGLAQRQNPASIATDGVYLVRFIIYRGDTRGQEWYMDMACEARSAADVPNKNLLNAGF